MSTCFTVLNESAQNLIDSWFLTNARDKLKTYPDGVIKSINNRFYNDRDELIPFEKISSYLEKNSDDIKAYIIANCPKLEDYVQNDVTDESEKIDVNLVRDKLQQDAIDFMKNVDPSYKVPGYLERADRKIFSAEVEKAMKNAFAEMELEIKIATGGATLPRGIAYSLDFSKTPEARQANKELVRLLLSNNPAEKKAGYEIVIDKMCDFDLERANLDNKNLMLTDTKYLLAKAITYMDAQANILSAEKAGVKLDIPRFEEFSKKSGAYEYIADMWRYRFACIPHPCYEVVDFEKFKLLDENIVSEQLIAGPGLEASKFKYFNDLGEVARLGRKNFNVLDKTEPFVSFSERVEKSYDIFGKSVAFDPGDNDISILKQKMLKDEKSYLGIKVKSSTALYRRVVEAIDAYRNAPLARREEMRIAALQRCNEYIRDRKENRKRTKLVREVKDFFEEISEKTQNHYNSAVKKTAIFITEKYKAILNDKIKNEPNEAIKRKIDALNEKKTFEKFVEKISKTNACKDLTLYPENYKELERKNNAIKEAVNEATANHNEEDANAIINANPVNVNDNANPVNVNNNANLVNANNNVNPVNANNNANIVNANNNDANEIINAGNVNGAIN